MGRIGFDNDQYLRTQSAHIRERIAQFGGKLYLEFGGKLYDDNHASRVLPGFQPDSKLRMLLQIKDQVEMVIAINADDIEKNKIRGDLGITYDRDVIRLLDVFRGLGLYVSSVVLTRYKEQTLAKAFQARLDIPRIPPISSATRASARTSILRPAVSWWWLPRPVPEAASWPPA